MKALCRTDRAADLGVPALGLYYSSDTDFHVYPGVTYTALAMGIFKGTLVVLIRDETSLPNWIPIGLFEFPAAQVPNSWRFRLCDPVAASSARPVQGWVAIWGFAELIEDDRYIDNLIDRDPAAMQIFFDRLREAEKSG